ncbi:MAG: hypothetical protein JXP34_19985 [Planctomycetes bacterium]|nr:hypothetical protein [Planctomycetota bacterium]
MEISLEPHPLLDASAFTTIFPAPLGETPSPDWLLALLAPDAAAPVARSEGIRAAIRDLLRHGGYKPTGRGKPSSEYLVRAAGEGALGSINAAVDACNAVSLASGLPISVIDPDRAAPPYRIAIAPEDSRYIFNPSGQEIRIDGLIALFDRDGPCANAVKDAQRTKTSGATRRTLSIIWGNRALPHHTERTTAWYREILGRIGAVTEAITFDVESED